MPLLPTKPSSYPRWADLAAPGDIIDPPASKKDVGWNTQGEKPPRGFFNWFWNLLYQWVTYFDVVADILNQGKVQIYANLYEFLDDPLATVGCVLPPPVEAFQVAWETDLLPQATYTGFCDSISANDRYVMAYVVSTSGAPSVADLYVFDAETGTPAAYGPLAPAGGVATAITTDGFHFWVAEAGGVINKYNPETGAIKATVTLAGAHTIQDMVVDGALLYVARQHSSPAGQSFIDAILADLSTSVALWTVTDNENQREWGQLALSPTRLYATVEDSTTRRIYIIDKFTGAETHDAGPDLEGHGVAADGQAVYWSTEVATYRSGIIVQNPLYGDEFGLLKSTQANRLAVGSEFLVSAWENVGITNEAAYAVTSKDEAVASLIAGGTGLSAGGTARAVATNGRLAYFGGQTVTGLLGTDWCIKAVHLPVGPTVYVMRSDTDPTRRFPFSIIEPTNL